MKNKADDVDYCGVDENKIIAATPKLREDMRELWQKWIIKRYGVFVNKEILKKEAPWTECDVLQKLKFTNVKREHDRATLWAISNICENEDLSLETKILNLILFRLYNKWETCEKVLKMPWSNLEMEAIVNSIAQYSMCRARFEYKSKADPEYVFFTSAFNTGGMKAAAGRLTGEDYIPMRPVAFLKYMMKRGIIDDLRFAETPEKVCNILSEYSGIGDFLSYQMFVDFTYCPEYRFSENCFTIAGPGCKMGLDFLFEDYDGLTHEEALFWLRDNQSKVLNIDFELLMYNVPEYDRNMNIMSLENSFCEFSKYKRAYDQIAEGKKPRARVSYNGTGDKTLDKKKPVKKATLDPNRTVEYMGKMLSPEVYNKLIKTQESLSGEKIVPCYEGKQSLFGNEPKPEYNYPYKFKDELKVRGDRKMFQFLGTNGSGKSTIPKGLVGHDKDAYVVKKNLAWQQKINVESEGHLVTKELNIVTVCPNFGVILVGGYLPETNIAGCDQLIRATMTSALEWIEKQESLKDYHILMEGVVLSSSKWHLEYFRDKLGIPPIMMFMDTPYEVCVERLKARNASQGKEFTNGKNVESKWHETKLKADRCIKGVDGYHGVVAEWVDHTMSIEESVEWFINNLL